MDRFYSLIHPEPEYYQWFCRHIRNIYNESELTRDTTCAKFAHMGRDGDQTYVTELFNLDVIISVGYRVKSQRGTQFRIWANYVLKEYLIKGYAVKNDLVQQKYDDLKSLVDVMGCICRDVPKICQLTTCAD